ncbi:MAG: FAD-binding protein, partial [Methylomonas sp.]
MPDRDLSADIRLQVEQAAAGNTALCVRGGNSKAFYGGDCQADRLLDMTGHSGVIAYEPSELVITARAGTPLQTVTDLLSSQRQMLAFEPPFF